MITHQFVIQCFLLSHFLQFFLKFPLFISNFRNFRNNNFRYNSLKLIVLASLDHMDVPLEVGTRSPAWPYFSLTAEVSDTRSFRSACF